MTIIEQLSIGRVWQEEGERNGDAFRFLNGTDLSLQIPLRMTYTTRPTQDLRINREAIGTNIEKRSCKLDISLGIPEFVWGQWTTWNEWSECQCRTNKRRRTRHCLGQSCEGCPEEYGACEAHCPTIRKWSEWTEWVEESYWSAWDVRPGVALRYRSPFTHPNISIDIEHQLISLSTKACVTPLWLCILCSICLISGFSAQCLIGRLFSYKI
uniref:PSI domain-containing protein n=1 Tax=Heterorhabditis bacteriophora TaxID=37862 RepID=A0A1I7X776_HETBA